jgi:regulator of replication initiation timing
MRFDQEHFSSPGGTVVARTSSTIDLAPIDRLEEKVRALVAAIERMRGDQRRVADENARLTRELEDARQRLVSAEGTGAEVTALRQERDQIRTRVIELIEQLDALKL